MFRNLMLILTMGLTVACGDKDDDDDDTGGDDTATSSVECVSDNACCDYVNAILGCYERAGYPVEQAGVTEETACAGYSSEADPYFECMADVWDGVTCDAAESITEAATAASTECIPQ